MHRPSNTIEVWLARPARVADGQWPLLKAVLDPLERDRAQRLRLRADRRSWVLAHALRRLVLGQWLGLPPGALQLADQPGTKPVLLTPPGHGLHFSHSRRRELVAFAVTRLGAIGIDVEEIRAESADFALLAPHLVVAGPGSADASGGDARSFYLHWTALEAFWKAQGSGLASGNPLLRCRPGPHGCIELSLEPGGPRAGRCWPIAAGDDHAIALALTSHTGGAAPDDATVSLRDGNQLIPVTGDGSSELSRPRPS